MIFMPKHIKTKSLYLCVFLGLELWFYFRLLMPINKIKRTPGARQTGKKKCSVLKIKNQSIIPR